MWVADTGDNRVVEFNEKGEYVRETTKTVGSHELSEPTGVATDASGDVWVTDTKNHRVVEFSSTGTSLKEFGIQGSGNGDFESPTGIAIDTEGNIWVADYVEDRVQEFSSKGEYLTKVGSAGSSGAQLSKPYFISVDAQGELLVADSANSRVSRWAHATWLPTTSEGPAATSTVSYTYKTVLVGGSTVVRPFESVAPHSSELSCAPVLQRGCRALLFLYAETTKATESEWGEYNGRLKEVLFVAYNTSTGKMQEIPVAQYAYDAAGRLRAEWDPRIKEPLKTVYGYDSEGHITALTPPGQEPWLLHYGTVPTDAGSGRLLSVTRPSAKTEPGGDLPPTNTVLPKLSTTSPVVGSKISVSSVGTWSNTPLAFSYQWEDCNSLGQECLVIPGAVNESYYPATSDEKHELVAEVIAVNAGGSTIAATAATGLVGAGTPNNPAPEPPNPGTNAVSTIEYDLPTLGTGLPTLTAAETERWGQKDYPVEGTAIFPPAQPMGWPAKEYTNATISYFDVEGRTVNVASPTGTISTGEAISTTEYDESNNAVRSLSADNRVLALKAGSKSVEVSQELDSRSVFNEEGNELKETLGPEHKIKLANGSEVQARKETKYTYNQKAPKTGGPYRLLTETVESALVAGKEEDKRVTQTNYFGQNGLGWTLRKPTSVTVDPAGLKLTTTTVYNPRTGAVVETGTPSGVQEKEIAEQPTYSGSFGSYGSGSGELLEPSDLATDAAGDVWVADTENSRLEEWNSRGEFVRSVGSHGTGNGQFEGLYGVAVDSKGDVWASEAGNDRIDEFTPEGVFVKKFGSQGSGEAQFNGPEGLAVDSAGNIYVADRGNHRIEELNSEGKYIRSIAKSEEKEGPSDVALDGSGNIWASYPWEGKIAEFGVEGTQLRLWGTKGIAAGDLEQAYRIKIGPEGDVWVAEWGNNRVQVFTPEGAYLYGVGTYGSGEEQLFRARGVSISGGNVYILDSGEWSRNTGNSRVEIWHLEPGKPYYSASFGSYGSGSGELLEPSDLATDASGDVWVADTENSRLEEWNSKGEFMRSVGSHGPGNGQFEGLYGVAVDSKGDVWVTEFGNDRVDEFSPEGVFIKTFGSQGSGEVQFKGPEGLAVDSAGNIYVADRGNHRIEELSSEGKYVKSFSQTVEGEGPSDVALDGNGNLWVSYPWEGKIAEFGVEGTQLRLWGTKGTAAGDLEQAYRIKVGPEGNVWVAEWGNNRVQVFTPEGGYLYSVGAYGSGPGEVFHARGVSISGTNVYVLDSGEWSRNTGNGRVETWHLNQEMTNGESAHDKQMIYYTGAANIEYPACGGHVEWEGMPCETRPRAQPEGSTAPPLPVTTVKSYNFWGEPETVEEAFGSTVRTKKVSYDEAGRVSTTEETSAVDTALPTITDTYSKTSGQLIEQSTTVGEEKQTITSTYDKLGRLTSYTDADKNTTTYEYEASGDGRLTGVSDPKGNQTYAYASTNDELTKLVDSSAGSFAAGYDVEGNMSSENYPNGMSASYTRSPTGEAAGIEYEKTTHCSEKCVLFHESIVPSIHGETLSRANSLTIDAYSYDTDGRLTQTIEEPTGKGCTTRIYKYDEDSDRTSLTTRAPGVGGKCATEGGTTETHTYDAADRLIDTGVQYEELGNVTKLPAADAGEKELTTEYYVDGQVRKQSQNKQTNIYSIDPAGRIRKTVGEETTKLTTIDHYGGPGEALTWKDEGEGKYTRLIPGIDGSLTATQSSGGEPVLQLHDLQGDIVATASLLETEAKLLNEYNSTEFGVPTNGTPPTKYSWLGASGVSSELSSGTLVTGTVSYVPQLGSALQTQPVTPPGAVPDGLGSGAAYVAQVSAWAISSSNEAAAKHAEEGAAEERAAEIEAAEKALQLCIEEGGCGAEVPGEETFGDPTHCYAGGELEQSGGKVTIYGYGGCNRGLPEGTWIKACVVDLSEFGPEFVKCKQTIVEHHTSKYSSIPMSATETCSEGDILRGYVAFYVPGGRTLYAGIEQTACGGSDESVWEALSPWDALPEEL